MRTLPLNLERRITMGLDQYGGWLQKPTKEEQLHSKIVNQPIFEHNCEFDWRKHAKLQEFMENLWSGPFLLLLSVKCFSITLAPSATAPRTVE